MDDDDDDRPVTVIYAQGLLITSPSPSCRPKCRPRVTATRSKGPVSSKPALRRIELPGRSYVIVVMVVLVVVVAVDIAVVVVLLLVVVMDVPSCPGR